MTFILQYLWLIPVLPLLAAGLIAVAKQRQKKYAAFLAIGSMAASLALAFMAFVQVAQGKGLPASAPRWL